MLRNAMLAASETATAWTAGEQRLVGSRRTPVDDQSRKKQSVLVLENLSKLCTGHWPVIGSNTTVRGWVRHSTGGLVAVQQASWRRSGGGAASARQGEVREGQQMGWGGLTGRARLVSGMQRDGFGRIGGAWGPVRGT